MLHIYITLGLKPH